MIRFLKIFILFVFSFVLFSSCKKEQISPTQGGLMAARLKTDLGNQTISQVYVYDYASGNIRSMGTNERLNDDGTITVLNGSSLIFNLESLITYSISGSTLSLYF